MPLSPPPELGARMLPEDAYSGKVVMVTGGGTGLGKSIAMEFARLGAKVAIVSRTNFQGGVDAIRAMGAEVVGVPMDVRDPASVAACFDAVETALGPVDVLVNNAAGNFEVPADRMSANAWKTVVDIVLNGTFYCTREFGKRRLAAGKGGAVLNVGAPYAATGGPSTAHSAAAKAGVVNLTWSLAVEWAADNIRINTLHPGFYPERDRSNQSVEAGSSAATLDAQIARRLETIPAGRVGQARELGWLATFLCSDYANYITGQAIVLDGGNWLRRWHSTPFEPIRESFDRRKREAEAATAGSH
ncbi:MAG: short-chain dehydrogenase [Phenylobacterium sp.]|nr:short-chain dehydrogenase [Phenylobacterium sp.]